MIPICISTKDELISEDILFGKSKLAECDIVCHSDFAVLYSLNLSLFKHCSGKLASHFINLLKEKKQHRVNYFSNVIKTKWKEFQSEKCRKNVIGHSHVNSTHFYQDRPLNFLEDVQHMNNRMELLESYRKLKCKQGIEFDKKQLLEGSEKTNIENRKKEQLPKFENLTSVPQFKIKSIEIRKKRENNSKTIEVGNQSKNTSFFMVRKIGKYI